MTVQRYLWADSRDDPRYEQALNLFGADSFTEGFKDAPEVADEVRALIDGGRGVVREFMRRGVHIQVGQTSLTGALQPISLSYIRVERSASLGIVLGSETPRVAARISHAVWVDPSEGLSKSVVLASGVTDVDQGSIDIDGGVNIRGFTVCHDLLTGLETPFSNLLIAQTIGSAVGDATTERAYYASR